MNPKTFALMTGVVVGGTGLLGMFKATRKRMVEKREEMVFTEGYARIAGVIPTNTVFNWVRVGIGVTGVLCSRDEKSAVVFNRAVAASYTTMAIMGVIPATETVFGLMPIFGPNVLLHSGIAAAELLTEDELMEQARKVIPFRRVRDGSGASLS